MKEKSYNDIIVGKRSFHHSEDARKGSPSDYSASLNMKHFLVLEYEIVAYETLPQHKRDKASSCKIYLNGELIGTKNSAAYDGARLLLKLGYDPEQLMTTKSLHSQHYSWKPQPIWKWAKLTVKERDVVGLSTEAFRDFPGGR